MSEFALRWFTGAVTSGAAQRLPVSLIAGVGCVFLALLLASAVLIGMVRPDDRAKRLADRIERYGSRHVAVRAGAPRSAAGRCSRSRARRRPRDHARALRLRRR